ncbi:alpha/beta fold hydrolase [Gephyromycinifex aptenodytis]|uniref:alpha/beta fold hydrolase n=1 Tax=Gephyromycinifex aptenodytis TaxID=2716227 RepID=UPI001444DD04
MLAPTLVLVGSKDRANLAAGRALAEGIPGARYEVVPEAGPLLMRDQPETVNRLLYDFLA